MNEFNIINKETGEIWKYDNWEAIPNTSFPADGLSVYVRKKGLKFDSSSIFVLKEKKKKEVTPLCHPNYGTYLLIIERRIYTKMYQISIQFEFSNEYFYAYWFRILQHLQQDTGIIFLRDKKGNRIASNKSDLINICKATKVMFYKFWKECTEKHYIKEVKNHEFKDTPATFFIVNPEIATNGNKIPKSFMELFYSDVTDSCLEFIDLSK